MKRALALCVLAGLLVAASPPAEDPAAETEHSVKSGETLGGVAQRAAVPRVLIIEANGLKPPYRLHAGQTLVIPRRRTYTVQAGDTGFAIGYDYGLPWPAIATANGLDPKARLIPGKVLVIPTLSKLPAPEPVPEAAASPEPASLKSPDKAAPARRFLRPAPGMTLRGFAPRGARGAHDGIDIAGAEGDPVRAAAPGTVLFAGPERLRYGNLVVIDHGGGWHSAYAKLSKITVSKGAKVRAAQRIGLIGHTGETARTELHFELRQDNRAVDPEKLLPARE